MKLVWTDWVPGTFGDRLRDRSIVARARAEIAPPASGVVAALTARARSGAVRGGLLLAGLALAGGGSALLFGPDGPNALRQAQSVLAMLNLRSPGARATGDLVSSKPAALAKLPSGAGTAVPEQRALGKIFAPEEGAPAVDQEAFAAPFQPDVLDVVEPQGAALAAAPIGGGAGGGGVLGGGGGGAGGGAGGGGAGGGAGGGGAGGGGGGGGVVDGGPTPGGPPVAAVPEPATWLMMIVAFGLCGSMLRRGRRARPGERLCVPAA